jgi:hypothetical protein
MGRLKPAECSHSHWGRLAERAYCVGVQEVALELEAARVSSGQPEPEAVHSERTHWGTCTCHDAQERS